MSNDRSIAILQVHRLLQGAVAHGEDPGRLCARAGIAAELLASPHARVTAGQYGALMAVLTRVLRDEFWGLCSHPIPLGAFAQFCSSAVQCRTLERALDIGLRQYRLMISDFSPRWARRNGHVHVWLRERGRRDGGFPMARSSFLLLAYSVACWLVGRRIPLAGVDFATSIPSDHVDVQMLFQAPVRYGHCVTRLSFQDRWLDAPIRQDDVSLRRYLAASPAGLIVRYRDRISPVERVRAELRRNLEADLSLEQVASALSVPSHTLTRRLKDANQTFRELKQALRRDVAIDLLQHSSLAQEVIALRLGFSELSTFHRAFKDWTGVSPGAYRRGGGD